MKRRTFVASAFAAGAAACGPSQIVRFDPGTGPSAARTERVFVAAARDLGAGDPLFGQTRAQVRKFGWADVSIPPVHKPGDIEWPQWREPPDPARHFLISQQQVLPDMGALNSAMGPGDRILFVHGYNTRLPGLIYRVAQMRADFRPQMPMAAFAWPSGGDGRGYLYDRDSALFARDDLRDVLRSMTGPGRVFLVAHSLGSFLTMEALRELALSSDTATLSRIGGVILMSPDLDPDVFRRQAQAIGTLPQPFFLFVGQQDRALRLSSFLRGRKTQLGIIDSADKVQDLGVTVVDFTALADGEDFDHFVPITAPAGIRQMRGLFDTLRSGNPGFGRFIRLGERGPRRL